MTENRKRHFKAVSSFIIAGVFLIQIFLKINNPSVQSYPIRGVDVSEYQGEIDWQTLSAQNIDFAFVKATEGSSYKDPYFERNIEEAQKTDLRIGVYHFFSFESGGKTQAENFCSQSVYYDGMLPPVCDVEYYGEHKSLTDEELIQVKDELRTFVDIISEKYGVTPIIYATQRSYSEIIGDDFDDCGLWLRSVYLRIPKNCGCTFWQYSDHGRLHGYSGEEKYIDLNVFCGSEEEWENYRRKNNNSVS